MEAKSFGEFLKTERELRNIPLEELAAITRINIRYLKAIEDNEFDILPAETFAKGFIKSYAQHIGLDEEDVLLTYDYYAKHQMTGNNNESGKEKKSMSATKKLIIIILALVFILIFIIVLAYHSNKLSSPNPGEDVHSWGKSSRICQDFPGQSGSVNKTITIFYDKIADWES